MARPPPASRTLPLVLIGAGLVILVANIGGLDLARLARLWPLPAIAVGADILSRGRYRALLTLTTPLLVLLLYASSAPGGGVARAETLAQPLGGAQNAEVQLQVAHAGLRLDTAVDPQQRLAGTVATARGERLIQDVDRRGDTGRITHHPPHLRRHRRGPPRLEAFAQPGAAAGAHGGDGRGPFGARARRGAADAARGLDRGRPDAPRAAAPRTLRGHSGDRRRRRHGAAS